MSRHKPSAQKRSFRSKRFFVVLAPYLICVTAVPGGCLGGLYYYAHSALPELSESVRETFVVGQPVYNFRLTDAASRSFVFFSDSQNSSDTCLSISYSDHRDTAAVKIKGKDQALHIPLSAIPKVLSQNSSRLISCDEVSVTVFGALAIPLRRTFEVKYSHDLAVTSIQEGYNWD